MKIKILLTLTIVYLAVIAIPEPVYPEMILGEDGKLKLYGDLRFRLETDWDSQKSDGTERDDRTRARVRARLGLEYDPLSFLSFGARVVTGAKDSQQSPHITIKDFNNNDTGDKDAVLDKWYVKASGKVPWIWLGRNSFPFWKQNELFWDDDVTPAGVAGGFNGRWSDSQYKINAGYFALPDGAWDYNGNLAAGQFVYSKGLGKMDFHTAVGIFAFDGEPGAEHIRNGNGSRDYTIWVGSLQAKRQVAEKPLTLGLDLMHNIENYSSTDSDAFTAANRNEKDGYVLSAILGDTKKKGDWLLGYYYAYIETLSVNASYAQDDWVRWGSATQTDSSDLKGHEIRAGYAFTPNFNVVARLYLVEAITSQQDGNRLRVDFNYKF